MTIVVVCIAPSATELIGKAHSLSQQVRVIALCDKKDRETKQYYACGANEIATVSLCVDYCAQGTQIANALEQLQPDAVLFPATVQGRFLSAWAAAKLQTGLTADCTDISLTDDANLLQTRPAFGGNLIAQILCKNHRPQMASIRPGIFKQSDPVACDVHLPAQAIKQAKVSELLTFLSFAPSEERVPLQNAKMIVAGGKGVGGKEGFAILVELAELLGGTLGASRGAVDAGWASYAHQVGQTGVAVRPKLYLAFGISGMVQHIAGMNGAETVIAINNDRLAPIFDYADYGVVADWRETAETMIRYLRKRQTTRNDLH